MRCWSRSSGSAFLRRGADENDGATWPGYGTLDQDQATLDVDGVDQEVLRRLPHATEPAGHPLALEDPARSGAATDRARRAVLALDAVAGAEALEAVPLHATGEALALGLARDVDLLAGLERGRGELLAEAVVSRVGGAQLDQVTAGGDPGLGEVPGQRLGHLARVDRAEGDLDARIAVEFRVADLRD